MPMAWRHFSLQLHRLATNSKAFKSPCYRRYCARRLELHACCLGHVRNEMQWVANSLELLEAVIHYLEPYIRSSTKDVEE